MIIAYPFKQSMGGDHSTTHSEQFRKQDWQIIDRSQFCATWQHRRDPSLKVQQHNVFSSSEQDHQHEKQIFTLRKDHPQLVSAPFLSSQSSSDFCSSSYQQRLFIEKIPIRLSDIEHIPFPDFLHLYSQSLKGFRALSSKVGCFAVEEEYVGINERGVVKVWMNPDFSKSSPLGARVGEDAMVKSIIEMIDRNLDPSQIPPQVPSVRNFIYRRSERVMFEEAVNELENFANQFNGGQIPIKLECIERVGGIETIANRDRTFQNLQNVVPIGGETRYFQGNAVAQQGRSQLVDSQINSYFRSANPVRYFQAPNGQIVQNSPAPVLVFPNENIEIPRKQSFPVYGSEVVNAQVQPLPQISQLQQVPIQRTVSNAPLIPQQQPQPQGNILVQPNRVQYRQVKVGEASQGQTYPPVQPVPSGSQIIQSSRTNTASNLFNMVSNETNPSIRMPSEPQLPFFSNQRFIAQPPSQPQPQQVAISSSNVVPAEANPFVFNPQSQPQVQVQAQAQAQTQNTASSISTNYANNFLTSVLNQGTPTITDPSPSIPTYNYQSNFSSINMDDGKSSADFLKKLNEISNFQFQMKGVKYPPEPTEVIQETIEYKPYEYSNPFAGNSYSLERSSEPTKESGYEQSYSALQRESSASYQPSYSYQQYQGSYDS